MKRAFCVILTLITLSVCVRATVSCNVKSCDIYEFLTELCEAFDEGAGVGKGITYAENALTSLGIKQMAPERFGRLYTGRNEPPPCFSRIEGYALRLPSDESGFEIHIIRCVNRSDTAEVSNMLASRIEMLSSAEIRQYAPSTYLTYFENAEIYVRGRYVFLLATPNNEKCIKIIKDRRFA